MKLIKISPFLAFCALPIVGSAATQAIPFSFTPSGEVILTFNKVNFAAEDVSSIFVSVEMTTSSGSLSGDNDSDTEFGNYTAKFGINASLAHSGGNTALIDSSFNHVVGNDLSATDTTSGTLEVDDGDDGDTPGFDEGGPDYFTFELSDVSDSDSGEIASEVYSDYLGTGTYTITVQADQFQSITGVDGVYPLIVPADLLGFVTVEVIPVPEPSAYALIAGVMALGWIAIRRR